MPVEFDQTEALAAKVAEILASSSNEPGILEMNRLIKMTESVRLIEQAYSDMEVPSYVTQTSHLQA